jgi:hypothetical protein
VSIRRYKRTEELVYVKCVYLVVFEVIRASKASKAHYSKSCILRERHNANAAVSWLRDVLSSVISARDEEANQVAIGGMIPAECHWCCHRNRFVLAVLAADVSEVLHTQQSLFKAYAERVRYVGYVSRPQGSVGKM